MNSDNMGGDLCVGGKVVGPEVQIFGFKAKVPCSKVFFLHLLSSSCKKEKEKKGEINKNG